MIVWSAGRYRYDSFSNYLDVLNVLKHTYNVNLTYCASTSEIPFKSSRLQSLQCKNDLASSYVWSASMLFSSQNLYSRRTPREKQSFQIQWYTAIIGLLCFFSCAVSLWIQKYTITTPVIMLSPQSLAPESPRGKHQTLSPRWWARVCNYYSRSSLSSSLGIF